MITTLPPSGNASFYNQANSANSISPDMKRSVTQQLPAKQPKKLPVAATFNALPPWRWAVGAGAISGLLLGSISAFLVGKRFEGTTPEGNVYYNQRPFNQVCIEYSQAANAEEGKPAQYLSQTYTYKPLKNKTQTLTAIDIWDASASKNKQTLWRIEKLPTGQEGYRLGESLGGKLKVDTTKQYAIYNGAGQLTQFFAGDNGDDNQPPYFECTWHGEDFTGSVSSLDKESPVSYRDSVKGSISKEGGFLQGKPIVTLPTTVTNDMKDYVQYTEEFFAKLSQGKVPFKLPISEKPAIPQGFKQAKFLEHRLVAFAYVAIPTALAVTFAVGLVQWCMPPNKKKQPTTTKP
jgi:hypothetical protein